MNERSAMFSDNANPQPDGESVNLLDLQASRMVGIEGWSAVNLRAVEPNGILMKGAVCVDRALLHGARKETP